MVIKGNGGEGKSQIGAVLGQMLGSSMKDGSIGKISENRFSRADLEHIFSQIGEAVGFVDESVIVNAFLSTWCSHYKDEVTALLDKIKNQLPLLENEHL